MDIPLRDTGGDGPPVLFLHGLLVDGSIWDPVVERLPDHRCLVPELPLGSHTAPFPDRSRLTPQGVADLAAGVLDELALEDVTLVASDTGGALAQLIVTTRPERIGRLVLTPCDAFETFPPPLFKLLFVLGRTSLGLNAGIQPLRTGFGRRLPIAYGRLTKRASDEQLKRWIAPALHESRVRKDTAHFIRHCSRSITLDAAARLPAFDKPVTIAWPPGDPAFPFSLAERLRAHVPARGARRGGRLAGVRVARPARRARADRFSRPRRRADPSAARPRGAAAAGSRRGTSAAAPCARGSRATRGSPPRAARACSRAAGRPRRRTPAKPGARRSAPRLDTSMPMPA